MLCFSLPVQPSQADKHASPSPVCQFAVCWTYIFINLTLTKLFTILQGQHLPSVNAQTSTEVRQLMTNFASWGPAYKHWVESEFFIPHEAWFILHSCPSWGRAFCRRGTALFHQMEVCEIVSQQKFLQPFLLQKCCRKVFERGFNWKVERERHPHCFEM